MAIKTFKEILNNKGYRISSNDRKIFEEGNLQSFFGFHDTDAIEVIIYDSNDNQLPQKNDLMVRYIPITSDNIKDYFLIAEGTVFQQYQFPSEYFIDVERLLREAGYDNGIFKTQITLINKRVGSEQEFNKLWISEISPSRTEIRLFPLKQGLDTNKELKERFELFKSDGDFRDDTADLAFNFIETIKEDKIDSFIKSKYSEKWFNKLKEEFKIKDFNALIKTIHKKFTEACYYEFTNKNSKIGDVNFGKPNTGNKQSIQLSRNEIQNICKSILVSSINYYLFRPDVKTTTTFDSGIDTSLDEVGMVLQRLENHTLIDTIPPVVKAAKIVKAFQTDKELKLDEEIKKQLPADPDVIVVTPKEDPPYIPPPPPVEEEKPAPVKQTYWYSYKGYSGGTIYWTDSMGIQRSLYTNPNQEYDLGCAEQGTLSGFGPFTIVSDCSGISPKSPVTSTGISGTSGPGGGGGGGGRGIVNEGKNNGMNDWNFDWSGGNKAQDMEFE
jgi:hypothetical protein